MDPVAEAVVSEAGVEDIKFEDIQKILSELQEAISMATKRTTLLGKRLRSEVEEEDLKYALAEVERLEKAYLVEVAEGKPVPCWFEYVATHETLNKAT